MSSDPSRLPTTQELIDKAMYPGRVIVSVGLVLYGIISLFGNLATPTYKIAFELGPQWLWALAFMFVGSSLWWLKDPWHTFVQTLVLVTWALALGAAALTVDGASSTGPVTWLILSGLTIYYGRRARPTRPG